jgi:hypothetical protein
VRGQKTRIPTPDTPTVAQQPPALPKKKPVVAIAAAVTVLVVGGSAALLMSKGGGKGAPSVTPDTAQLGPGGQPSSQRAGNSTRLAGNTAARNAQRTQSTQSGDTTGARAEEPPASGITVSAADALDRLDALMNRFDLTGHTPAQVATASKDTALAYYNSASVGKKDRAYAAYILSQAEGALDNKSEALRWARIAVDLDPASKAYQANLSGLSRPPQ